MQLTAMCNKDGGPNREVTITVPGRNLAFLQLVASRAIRLEEARANASASHLLADDYADHELFLNDSNASLLIDKVDFDISRGYHHAPYIVFGNRRQKINLFGRFSLDTLKAILKLEGPTEPLCRACNDQLNEAEAAKGDGICTSCVVATI